MPLGVPGTPPADQPGGPGETQGRCQQFPGCLCCQYRDPVSTKELLSPTLNIPQPHFAPDRTVPPPHPGVPSSPVGCGLRRPWGPESGSGPVFPGPVFPGPSFPGPSQQSLLLVPRCTPRNTEQPAGPQAVRPAGHSLWTVHAPPLWMFRASAGRQTTSRQGVMTDFFRQEAGAGHT